MSQSETNDIWGISASIYMPTSFSPSPILNMVTSGNMPFICKVRYLHSVPTRGLFDACVAAEYKSLVAKVWDDKSFLVPAHLRSGACFAAKKKNTPVAISNIRRDEAHWHQTTRNPRRKGDRRDYFFFSSLFSGYLRPVNFGTKKSSDEKRKTKMNDIGGRGE